MAIFSSIDGVPWRDDIVDVSPVFAFGLVAFGFLGMGPVTIDKAARRVTVKGQEVVFTATEFDLLAHLMAHPGTAFSRRELMEQVWGWEYGDESTVTVHVRGSPASPNGASVSR